MKGHPLKVATKLFNEGYAPKMFYMGVEKPEHVFCAWKSPNDHKWITKQQFKLLKNLYDKGKNDAEI